MQVYLVERSLKGMPMNELAEAQKRAISTAAEMTKEGTPVRYIRSTFVPNDGCCLCLFAANDAEEVKKLNEKANIPFDSVIAAIELIP